MGIMATDTDSTQQWNCNAGERWEAGSLLMMLVPAKGAEFEIMRKMRCKNESENEHFRKSKGRVPFLQK